MKTILSLLRTRAAVLLGLAGLALSQTGCAHPVVMEPSVVVRGRLGGPVYGAVTYGPPPVWLPPPPPVVMAPRVVVQRFRPGHVRALVHNLGIGRQHGHLRVTRAASGTGRWARPGMPALCAGACALVKCQSV